MKHGRRHNKLKEQAYLARKSATGYGRAEEPLPLEEPDVAARAEAPDVEDAPDLDLASVLGRKAKHALRHAGVDPDDA